MRGRYWGMIVAAAVLAVSATAASASTRLGGPTESWSAGGTSYGCEPTGTYSPCTRVNMHSTNPETPVAAPVRGVITTWRMEAYCCTSTQTAPRTITLGTYVPGPNDGAASGVGQAVLRSSGPVLTVPPGQGLSGVVSVPVRMPIQAGERPGILVEAPIRFSTVPFTGITTVLQYPGQATGFANENFTHTYNVEFEPDADADGYGDETQDCDPTNPSQNEPDGSCRLLFPPPPPDLPPVIDPDGKCEKNCGARVIFAPKLIFPRFWEGGDPKFFYVGVNCPASNSQPCGGYVTVTRPKPKAKRAGISLSGRATAQQLAKASYVVSPGKKKQLKVSLSKAARTALKQKGKLKVQITVVPNSGNAQVFTKTLKYKKRKSG